MKSETSAGTCEASSGVKGVTSSSSPFSRRSAAKPFSSALRAPASQPIRPRPGTGPELVFVFACVASARLSVGPST